MTSPLNKLNYPYLFGPFAEYCILVQNNITTTTNTNYIYVNNASIGSASNKPISSNIIGTINNTDASNAMQNLTHLITDINSLSIPKILYSSSSTSQTFYSNCMYYTPTNTSMSITGSITFDGSNNPNAQFFIVSGNSLSFPSGNLNIQLINGAQAGNIFWVSAIDSITFSDLPTICTIYGNFIASASISFTSEPSVINGTLLAKKSISFINDDGNITINAPVICYLKGSKILTSKGYVAIENIYVDDEIVTKNTIVNNKYLKYNTNNEEELKKVIWISSFTPANLNNDSFPICFKAGTFGENLPIEDLFISPNHSIFINNQLICAKHLVNGTTIFQDTSKITLEYYHLELNTHSLIIANGLLAESYLDWGQRYVFKNSLRIKQPRGFPSKKFFTKLIN